MAKTKRQIAHIYKEITRLFICLPSDGAINIPDGKLHLLKRSADMNLQRTPEEFGGGAAAMIWGYHQLHYLVRCAHKEPLLGVADHSTRT
jgi:hypothetical protein